MARKKSQQLTDGEQAIMQILWQNGEMSVKDIAAALSDRSGIEGFATPGRQRGDSTTKDKYVVIGIGIMRYFGFLPCPKISNF